MNSIRGRISMISTRHAQSSNPSFPDARLPKQNLIHLDADNLYVWAMAQLHTGSVSSNKKKSLH